MQRQIRRVGIGLMIAFLAVFLQLNYVQIFAAKRIASNGANKRALYREYSIKRGDIVTVDGVQVATSEKTTGEYKYRRTYPEGELYGHITGYYSLFYGSDRIERTYNDQLLGDEGVLSMQDIEDRLFDKGTEGETVRLTIDSRLQEAARTALGDNRGAVVAIEPATGEVRAMWSNPSFDPEPLATHDAEQAAKYWKSLRTGSADSPLFSLATSRGYPPGSTFKVVTTAAALETGGYTRDSTFEDPLELELPQTNETLTNFSKSTCAGGGEIDLFTALVVSCDTTYAILGLEIPDDVRNMAEDFGFNSRLPIDVSSQPSQFPKIPDDQEPLRAYAAIGQGDTNATPMQMALVAAGVANGGDVPTPHFVRDIIDPSGKIVRHFEPDSFQQAMSSSTASTVTEMMVGVVDEGTGTAAQIPNVKVAGKTGTAQTVEGENPHTWFICFAPADNPQIAVAVIVENGGTFGSEATGGAVAAPIARAILEADRAIDKW
jgi:peptidoglycan glycosyltransferase